MTRADFSGHSKDETIEYLINEYNAMEHELADLRQELAESKEIIAEFKRMIFASRSEKKHVGYEKPEQQTLKDLFNEAEFAADPTVKEPIVEQIVKAYTRYAAGEKSKKHQMMNFMILFLQETCCAKQIRETRSVQDVAA